MSGALFIRIFIGFWLATVAILGSWMLTSHYFDSAPDGGSFEHRRPGPPQRFMLRTIYQLQNLDDKEISELVTRVKADHNITIYLLNRRGEDLFGRRTPAQVKAVAGELDHRRRAFHDTPDARLLAHTIYREELGPLRAVFAFPPPRHDLLGLLSSYLWLRIGLAILISGLVCYWLSRLMTRRLKELQLASRQLAMGDLDARLRVRDRGGDETDELGRDFNSMAQQLQERIEDQKRLLADVSHELRSPLARLRIALALAQESPDKSHQNLQRIERETERLEQLIGQLLASQAGTIELDTHIDLLPLLRQLCSDANFEGAGQGKRVALSHNVLQALVASSGDLLHKSLENILRNALTHTPADSTVRVTLDRHDEHYRICVEDQGGGVPGEDLARIFDPFYRTDTARSRETGGHGLGLAIARGAILRHGGQVRAENSRGGLVVTVLLPAADL
jgi:two-component system sensor histidine kinase CpxA